MEAELAALDTAIVEVDWLHEGPDKVTRGG
jgi:hypothetical protein